MMDEEPRPAFWLGVLIVAAACAVYLPWPWARVIAIIFASAAGGVLAEENTKWRHRHP